jgi:hypothetical protein
VNSKGKIFDGAAYEPSRDRVRLALQVERVRVFMLGGEWHTLREIKTALEDLYVPAVFPESSISAQLRNLRKPGYSYRLLKRRRVGVHGPGAGIWEYRLLLPELRQQLGLFVEKKSEEPPAATGGDSEPDDGCRREEFFREAVGSHPRPLNELGARRRHRLAHSKPPRILASATAARRGC